MYPAFFVARSFGSFGSDIVYTLALFRFYALLVVGISLAWLLQPSAAALLNALRNHLGERFRQVLTSLALLAACLFVGFFLVATGRHQFGAWDYNILIEVAWRQFLGQRPFVDFITPTPPLFNWLAGESFRLFGASWNATLYLSAIFSSLCLIWTFFLLRALGMRPVAALGISLVTEIAAMLTCCFWWYNNTTLILAMLFYLASILLARVPASRLGQVSFVLLLAWLPLTKPNIAGVLLVSCCALLLAMSHNRLRLCLLMLGGLVLCGLFLWATNVSVPAMLATYRGIAKERGGFSTFGFQSLSIGEQRITWLLMPVFFLPLASLWRPLKGELRNRRWRRAAFWLFFPVSTLVAIIGIAGNGELRDVECTLLIGAWGLLAFVYRTDSPVLRRAVVALLCGVAISDLYAGAARLRVYTIKNHSFFEWHDNENVFHSGFLKDLRASRSMMDVNQQVTQALHGEHGTVFFGPRLDFEYAVQNVPSPLHWVTFFQPGTSFDRAQGPALVKTWSDHRYQTAVFLKDEYVFYPRSLMDELETKYQRDDHNPYISIYRRRPGVLDRTAASTLH